MPFTHKYVCTTVAPLRGDFYCSECSTAQPLPSVLLLVCNSRNAEGRGWRGKTKHCLPFHSRRVINTDMYMQVCLVPHGMTAQSTTTLLVLSWILYDLVYANSGSLLLYEGRYYSKIYTPFCVAIFIPTYIAMCWHKYSHFRFMSLYTWYSTHRMTHIRNMYYIHTHTQANSTWSVLVTLTCTYATRKEASCAVNSSKVFQKVLHHQTAVTSVPFAG